MRIHGSCLCKGVRYEVNGPFGQAANCHCSRCRKWSGSAFVSYAGVAQKDFRWIDGEEMLGRFASSERIFRVFCTRCGSTLASWPSDPAVESVWVMLGTLDEDPGTRPAQHIYVGYKAPWFEIADNLPQRRELRA